LILFVGEAGGYIGRQRKRKDDVVDLSRHPQRATSGEYSRRPLNRNAAAESSVSMASAKHNIDDKDSETVDDNMEPFDDDDVADHEHEGRGQMVMNGDGGDDRIERGTMSQTTDSEDNVTLFR